MSTSGSKSNEHVAHFLVDIHKEEKEDFVFLCFFAKMCNILSQKHSIK